MKHYSSNMCDTIGETESYRRFAVDHNRDERVFLRESIRERRGFKDRLVQRNPRGTWGRTRLPSPARIPRYNPLLVNDCRASRWKHTAIGIRRIDAILEIQFVTCRQASSGRAGYCLPQITSRSLPRGGRDRGGLQLRSKIDTSSDVQWNSKERGVFGSRLSSRRVNLAAASLFRRNARRCRSRSLINTLLNDATFGPLAS